MESTNLREKAVGQQSSHAFDVFISYSRKDRDFAVRLENALESYRFPRSLKSVKRNLNVFRDEADIVASEDYHRTIKEELAGSAKLVVVCSPDARKSKFVDDEIRRFIENHGEEDIIPVLVRGKANNETPDENEMAFPAALCENRMPLAANFLGWETHKGKLHKGPLGSSFYSVLAAIHGIDRRKLEQIDEKVRARRRALTLGAASIIILILSVALVFAVRSQRKAVEATKAEKKAKDEAVVAKNEAIAQKGIAVKAQRKLQLQLLRAIAANTIKDVLSIESLPGEIFVTDPDDWVTLMKKNDQVFLTAREYNSGRVLAAGHDGVLTKADQEGKFLQPAFEWLKANGDPSILFSTGHCEVEPTVLPLTELFEQLKEWKYTVQPVPGVIDDAHLKGKGVLVIGNAWGNLTDTEIKAIEKFVSNGGGLFVVGLGWSWNQDSTTNPDFKCKEQEQIQGQNVNDMSTYPMNRVVEPYKMRWTEKDIPRGQ